MRRGGDKGRWTLPPLAPRDREATERMMASVRAMTTWHMAVVDSWLLLVTASLGVLPEDIPERCEIRRGTDGHREQYHLHVDGGLVGILHSTVGIEGTTMVQSVVFTPPPRAPAGGWVAYLRDPSHEYDPGRSHAFTGRR